MTCKLEGLCSAFRRLRAANEFVRVARSVFVKLEDGERNGSDDFGEAAELDGGRMTFAGQNAADDFGRAAGRLA